MKKPLRISNMTNDKLENINWVILMSLVALLAVLPFWPSINGEFVFDDTEAIVRNRDVRDPNKTLLQIFTDDFWGEPLTSNNSHKSYRPLTVLTFRWNYMDKLDSKLFHIVNLLFHVIACCLVWFVYEKILSSETCKQFHGLTSPSAFATVLFATHPIHTENVAGIVGRADILASICFFGSFLLYAKASDIDNYVETRSRLNSAVVLICSFCLAFVGMLFKENGITVLGFCFCYDVTRYYPFGSHKPTYRRLILRLSGLIISGIIAISFRWWIMCSLPKFQPVDNPASFADSLFQRFVNYNYVYSVNAWLLISPVWLCFDWSMGCIPLIQHLFDLRILAVIALWSVLAALLMAIIIRRHSSNFNRQLTMALMLIILPFLPASNILVTVGFVVAERVLYLSSAGFCLIIALGYDKLRLRVHRILNFDCCFILLLLIFTARCWQRSNDWRTEEKLFNSGVSVCPSNAKIHYNIAKNSADNGRTDLAIAKYREALHLYPEYDQAMNNLANLLKDGGNLIEAEILLLRTVQIRYDFAAAWMNLGIVQAFLKKYRQAEQSYLTALRHRPNYPDCYYNIGNLFLDLKLYEKAYESWRNATVLKETHLGSWNNMVIMFDNIGDFNKAKELGQAAVKVLPNEAFVYFNLANVLGKLGDFSNSEINFLKAITINATNPTYYTNLGVLYHRWKRYNDAIKAYQSALRLNPNAKSARDNLLQLLPGAGVPV